MVTIWWMRSWLQMESLAGRVCVVTGASSGIGKETALGLARCDADVVLVGRTPKRLTAAEQEVASVGRGAVSSHLCDFARLDDVRALAETLLECHDAIHVLVNNAGQVLQKREETADGYEATFAVNHLAPYLLTRLLLDRLLASTPSRVVTVSSDAYRWGLLDFDDLMTRDTSYRPLKVYGNSKLANALFSWELARRTTGSGLTSNAVHPGFVSTSLGRDNAVANVFLRLIRPFVRGPAKGAETSIYVATAAEGGERSGEFWVDCKPVPVQPKARDPEWGLRLWEVSADLVGLPRD
jgi:NAD(P)-dependent dehydrogenase (short-subunit alcohol dehydrogenase family)